MELSAFDESGKDIALQNEAALLHSACRGRFLTFPVAGARHSTAYTSVRLQVIKQLPKIAGCVLGWILDEHHAEAVARGGQLDDPA